ncbi:MAG: DNA polymerase IV [Candidatus Yanofskybacteria bacterium]|nr:DNA polymerase IV [Candidatus Yanofskybacteria bacterium]
MIAHLDMDAFFAAIEERDNPRWHGMPIVVGSDPREGRGRGVVSTANYPARKYGIRSALPIRTAWRLAREAAARGEPETLFLPVNGRRYGEISERIMGIIGKHAETVEQASVDESYFDLSHLKSWRSAEAVCRAVKRDILLGEGLTCSIGLGANKLIAKIASDFRKPDGFTVVRPRAAMRFLAPLDVRRMPGIGPKAELVLKQEGLATIGDLQRLTEADLWRMFGEWGLELYEQVRGRGAEALSVEWTPRSVGEQETFDVDTLDSRFVGERLAVMCSSVIARMRREGFIAYRRVVLTVRFSDFRTVTRSHMLPTAARAVNTLKTEALRLLLPFFDRRENVRRLPLRLVGIRVEELREKPQRS